MMVDQLEYLYSMVTRGDQRPAGDAHRRYDELRSEIAGIEGMLAAAISP